MPPTGILAKLFVSCLDETLPDECKVLDSFIIYTIGTSISLTSSLNFINILLFCVLHPLRSGFRNFRECP